MLRKKQSSHDSELPKRDAAEIATLQDKLRETGTNIYRSPEEVAARISLFKGQNEVKTLLLQPVIQSHR